MPFSLSLANGQSPFSHPADSSNELWQRLEARRPLPLHFVLHLSRRPNASLCPCLQVELPSTVSPGSHFTVTRILDPEHRVPYISLSPLFLASGLSIIQGLLRFSLSPSDYDLSLAGLEPFDDLWISLPLARSIAAELDLLPSLAAILDPKTVLAWSLDEFGEGLSHNWRVPEEVVSAAGYSTDAILAEEAAFGGVQMLPRGQQIKTLVSGELRGKMARQAQERRREAGFVLHQKLIRWSSQLFAVWTDVRDVLEWEGEGEEGRERWRMLKEDLREVSVHPTSVDMMEWMQLLSGTSTQLRPPTETLRDHALDLKDDLRDEAEMLQPLSLAELSYLRSDNSSSDTVFPVSRAQQEEEESEETVRRTRALPRAKLAALHRMTILSLPHLAASLRTLDPPDDPPLIDGAPSRETTSPTRLRDTAEAENQGGEVALLNSKIDQLSAKVDAFIDAQARCGTSQSLPAAAKDPNSHITFGQAAQTSADSSPVTQPVVRHEFNADLNTGPPPLPAAALQNIETTPSLFIIFISTALFFAIIHYQH